MTNKPSSPSSAPHSPAPCSSVSPGGARSRVNQLEDRLITALGNRDGTDVDDRINELAQRVAQLGRGQEFVQHLLSGKRYLPHSGKPIDTTPS